MLQRGKCGISVEDIAVGIWAWVKRQVSEFKRLESKYRRSHCRWSLLLERSMKHEYSFWYIFISIKVYENARTDNDKPNFVCSLIFLWVMLLFAKLAISLAIHSLFQYLPNKDVDSKVFESKTSESPLIYPYETPQLWRRFVNLYAHAICGKGLYNNLCSKSHQFGGVNCDKTERWRFI